MARKPRAPKRKPTSRKAEPRKSEARKPAPPAPETTRSVSDSRHELEASDKIYYRIGEVADLTGVKPYVLRYWESEFKWMAPGKSRSNQRLYRKQDIETILLIKRLLYEERFTIAGAKKRLKELGSGAERASALAEPMPMDPGDWAGNLREIRTELEAIRALL